MPYRLGKLPDMSGIMNAKPVIWIHALSVGEVNAAIPLVEKLEEQWPDAGIICSASTATGLTLLEQRLSSHRRTITSMPMDLAPIVNHVLNHIRPDCFILTETDIWPGLIWALKKRTVPALLVNGSISQRASERLSLLRHMGIDAANLIYGGFHTVAMQSQDDVYRLENATGQGASRIICAGNLKFDIRFPVPDRKRRATLMQQLCIDRGDFVFVAGSTHHGEEKVLLRCLKRAMGKNQQGQKEIKGRIRMIIAPRDPQRAKEVLTTAHEYGLHTSRRSKRCSHHSEVIILDTLGELAEVYGIGHAAFVGGTLVPVGGHNLLEPAAHGIPVFYGPYVESCRDMADMLQTGGAGAMVTSAEELQKWMRTVARRGTKWRSMGQNAIKLLNQHRGAADRYLRLVETALTSSGRL